MAVWFEQPIAVLDTETTSLNVEDAHIIEVGIVCFKNGDVEEVYDVLIDPGVELPEETTKVTGITKEDLKGQPAFIEVVDDIMRCLKDRIFVAYNASYDLGVLKTEMRRIHREMPELTVIDPLILARGTLKLKSYTLSAVAKHLNVVLNNAHRAKFDAEATGKVLYALKDYLPQDLGELLKLQSQWASAQNAERRWHRGVISSDTIWNSSKDTELSLGPSYIYSKTTDIDPLKAFVMDFASKHPPKNK